MSLYCAVRVLDITLPLLSFSVLSCYSSIILLTQTFSVFPCVYFSVLSFFPSIPLPLRSLSRLAPTPKTRPTFSQDSMREYLVQNFENHLQFIAFDSWYHRVSSLATLIITSYHTFLTFHLIIIDNCGFGDRTPSSDTHCMTCSLSADKNICW